MMPNRPLYKDVAETEDRENLLANANFDRPVQDEGGQRQQHWGQAAEGGRMGMKQPEHMGGIMGKLQKHYRLIHSCALVLILALQLCVWHQMRRQSRECQWEQVGGDYLNQATSFPLEVVQWKADPDFVPLNATEFLNPKVQQKWETLYPAGAAFGLDGLVYNSTSVTHQLHCVYIMGKIFSAVLTKSPNMPEPDDYEAHFLHCVDYMRQAAMCGGDLAIEPRGENGEPGPVILDNAFNGLHECKDYRQVQNFLEKQVRDGARNILPLDD